VALSLGAAILLPSIAFATQQPMSSDAANAQLPAAIRNLGPGHSTLHAANAGVACDGSTDNTKALQNAVLLAQQLAFPQSGLGGARLELPAGFCVISGPIQITSGLTIEGAGIGGGVGYGNSGGTIIRTTSPNSDVFTVMSDGAVVFSNLQIDSIVGKTSGAGISINGGSSSTANLGTRINGVRITKMYNAVALGNAFGWKIRDSIFQDFQNVGVLLTASSTFSDGSLGGSLLDGNTIVDLNVGGSNACVEIQGGGDIAVSKNKILGSHFGVSLNLKHGPTGTLLISTNSFEEQKGANIALTQSVQGMEYGNVVITGNELLQLKNVPTFGEIYIGTGTPVAAARWLRHVVISDNVIGAGQGTPIPNGLIQINDGTDIVLSSNVLSADGNPSTVGVWVGPNARNVKVSTSNIMGDMPAGLGVTPQ